MLFEAKSMYATWESSVKYLLAHYISGSLDLVPTEKGNNSIELTNVLLTVQDVYAHNKPFMNNNNYANDLLKQNQKGNVYSRITKLASINGLINQENELVLKLQDNWFSRRAVITLWQPDEDIDNKYPPCVCMMQFLIRDNKLQLHTVFRSNDAWTCALQDMQAFIKYQKQIAKKLNIKASFYSQYAMSYHIYEQDIQSAKLYMGV